MSAHEERLAPQQERSRETLARLLHAGVKVLEAHGLEGASVPRIAAAAGVAPASIYRRFEDKDALLRAVFLHVLAQSNRANQERLRAAVGRRTLRATVERLAETVFAQYREHPRLLQALGRFMDMQAGTDFAREAQSMLANNMEQICDVVLAHREEIAGRAPEQRVKIALLMALNSIEIVTLGGPSLWHVVLPLEDAEFVRRIGTMLYAMLRGEQPG